MWTGKTTFKILIPKCIILTVTRHLFRLFRLVRLISRLGRIITILILLSFIHIVSECKLSHWYDNFWGYKTIQNSFKSIHTVCITFIVLFLTLFFTINGIIIFRFILSALRNHCICGIIFFSGLGIHFI
jgi:hypothetical protein